MANQRLTREQLGVQPKDSIAIKGNVSYSRILTKVEGEELKEADARRAQKNQIVIGKPYYSITITNPVVTHGAGTPLATFHEQSIYTNKNGEPAMSFTSKSAIPIRFYQLAEDGSAHPVTFEAELGQNQEVWLLIDAYRPKNFNNIGSTFSAVMVPAGEIKYYQSGIANDLAGFGVAPSPTQNAGQSVPQPNLGVPTQTQPMQNQTQTQAVPTQAPFQQAANQAPTQQPNQTGMPSMPPGGPFGTAQTQPDVGMNPFMNTTNNQ